MEKKEDQKRIGNSAMGTRPNHNSPSIFLSRRDFFKFFGLLGVIAGAGIDPLMLRKPAEAGALTDQVIFRTPWVPGGKESPYWLAREKGFWSKNGIDVVLRGGIGAASNAQLIGAGRDDFGIVDVSIILASRLEGVPIKMLGLHIAKLPIILISKKEKNIREPKDLVGKKVITGPGNERLLFQVLLKLHQVDASKVQHIIGGRDYSMLMLQDQVDATTELAPTILPTFKSLGFEEGKNLNIMKFSDFGFSKLLGLGVCTSDSMITKKRDLVKRFVPPIYEGIRYAMAHPDEAAQIFVKYYPEMDKEIVLEGLKISFGTLDTKEAREHTLGWISKEDWEWTQNLLFDIGQIKSKLPVEDCFTNEFLSGPPHKP